MKTKMSLAAFAVAAVMLAMPVSAQAGFYHHGWCKRDCLFGWLHHDHCQKVVTKKYKKVKHAKKHMK